MVSGKNGPGKNGRGNNDTSNNGTIEKIGNKWHLFNISVWGGTRCLGWGCRFGNGRFEFGVGV